jgi:hypothetical protein
MEQFCCVEEKHAVSYGQNCNDLLCQEIPHKKRNTSESYNFITIREQQFASKLKA